MQILLSAAIHADGEIRPLAARLKESKSIKQQFFSFFLHSPSLTFLGLVVYCNCDLLFATAICYFSGDTGQLLSRTNYSLLRFWSPLRHEAEGTYCS